MRRLQICSSWKYDTLNTFRWNATTVISCTCGLFLYTLRNTNKHFWRRCRGTVVIIVSEPNSLVYYVLSFFLKRKKLLLLSFLTMKPFHEPPPSKPVTASSYKLWPGFGSQAYDHKLSTVRRYPDYHKKILFLSIKARTCFQASIHLRVFLFANHDRLRSRRIGDIQCLKSWELHQLQTLVIFGDATHLKGDRTLHSWLSWKSKCRGEWWESHHKATLVKKKKMMLALPW
jgi:hypothetical protein